MHDRPEVPLIALVPQHLRNRDAAEGRPLEALFGLLGAELGIVERDIDQMYDNWFIESCEPWVIPYIGALIGARPLRSFGSGEVGLRSYIANTLGYRQAKGTAAALEQIARDVTGWPVIAVEFFQKLIWSQNVNHVRPDALGTASIRDAEAARLAHGPFEVACHTAAAGNVSGFSGRYNIPNIGLFVWRLDSLPLGYLSNEPAGYLGGLVPRASTIGPQFRFFDPLGADRGLFNRLKADRSIAGRVDARMVPAPLDRRLLHRDLNQLRDGVSGGGQWFDDLPVLRIRLDGSEVPPVRLHSCNLETRDDGSGNPTWRQPQTAGHVLFDPELGRIALHASDQNKSVETTCAFAAPFMLGGGPYDRTASFAAWRDRFIVPGEPPPWVIGVSARTQDQTTNPLQGGVVVASLAEAIVAWNLAASAGMRGLIILLDNASYAEEISDAAHIIKVPPDARLAIVAAAWPKVQKSGGIVQRDLEALVPLYRRPHIQGNIRVRSIPPAAGQEHGEIIFDGLLIEGEIAIKAGALGQLSLHHCTVGATAMGLQGGLRVISDNGTLQVLIDHSILGSIALEQAGGGLTIEDSIIGEDRDVEDNPDSLPVVLSALAADTVAARVTVLGRGEVRALEAENCIFYARIRAAQRQSGCMRFCYAPPTSRVPRRYRCQPDLALEAAAQAAAQPLTSSEAVRVARSMLPIFSATSFPANAFGQLALMCPPQISAGGFGGAEMGAGFAAGEPFRRANLADMLDEYLPFGLAAVPLFLT